MEARLVRLGFYPRDAGRIEIKVTPAPLVPIECTTLGALVERSVTKVVAALPPAIAERIDATARKSLTD